MTKSRCPSSGCAPRNKPSRLNDQDQQSKMASLDKKYFQRLLESSPDIIIAVDKSGTVNYYNDGARTSLGYSSEEIIGEGCTRIYPSIDEARRVLKAMRESSDKGRIN